MAEEPTEAAPTDSFVRRVHEIDELRDKYTQIPTTSAERDIEQANLKKRFDDAVYTLLLDYYQKKESNEVSLDGDEAVQKLLRWADTGDQIGSADTGDQIGSKEVIQQAQADAKKAIAKANKPAKEEKKPEPIKIDNKTQLAFELSKVGESPTMTVRGNMAVFQKVMEAYCKEKGITLHIEKDKETGKTIFNVPLSNREMPAFLAEVQKRADAELKTVAGPSAKNAGVQKLVSEDKIRRHFTRWLPAPNRTQAQALQQVPATVPTAAPQGQHAPTTAANPQIDNPSETDSDEDSLALPGAISGNNNNMQAAVDADDDLGDNGPEDFVDDNTETHTATEPNPPQSPHQP